MATLYFIIGCHAVREAVNYLCSGQILEDSDASLNFGVASVFPLFRSENKAKLYVMIV